MKTALILASASPRRRDILTRAGYTFKTIPPDIDEAKVHREISSPEKLTVELARQKALKIFAQYTHSNCAVIASDTVVAVSENGMELVLGQPRDEDDAKAMLRKLSGRTHSVYTAIAIFHRDQSFCGFDRADLRFKKLSSKEIEDYVKSGEGADKAGSYAYQGEAGAFVESLEGDEQTVIGLPLRLLEKGLAELGVK